METIDNYIKYRKLWPQYKQWRKDRAGDEAKRLSYIKANKIDEAQKQDDIKRARAVLNAVDVMDEYSQTRAEDMEAFIKTSTSNIASYGMLGAGGIGFLLGKLLTLKANKKVSLALSSVLALVSTLAAALKYHQWGARKEIEASRNGRFEAMTKDLSSFKQFAVLDEKQEKEVEQKAKTIKISDKELEKLTTATKGFGIISSLKQLFAKDSEEIANIKKEFKEKLKADEENITSQTLSDKEITEAKKDKQLIQNIVEKIDIQSQDYAENIELATDVVNVAAFGGGGLLGVAVNKVLKHTKIDSNKSFYISAAVGFSIASVFSFFAAKLQKQGSRVARYKVKQDFMNNPDKLIYVDDEKIKNQKIENNYQEKKTNPVAFLIQVFKDNKEYNEYLKNENKLEKQKMKAREEITLTPEQEKRARQLQHNTFKMFNKLDEKSQSFSEHTEALGEFVLSLFSFAALCFGFTGIPKAVKNMEKVVAQTTKEPSMPEMIITSIKTMSPFYKRFFLSMVPLYIFNAFVTKEQKGASRVADMLAINEMNDYRQFADYTNSKNA